MSTTTESQPQRDMLSAEAELGMPSQPLTATPPFFQSVFSLFSRKASLPIELCFGRQWAWLRCGVNPVLRWPAMRGNIASLPHPRRAARFHRVIHDAEQEE